MTSALITAAALLSGAQTPIDAYRVYELAGAEGGEPRFQIHVPEVRGETKISPKQGWLFEWTVAALARQSYGETPYVPRFRVFSQMRKTENDPAPMVARMALRLWDFNIRKLKLDHNPSANRGIVDFYLCFGGKAGGEHVFQQDTQGGSSTYVHTIYIYAVHTFTDPLEMAREVAHEYGHAALPAIGGFKEPEDWANGHLGERLYLKWMSEEVAAKRLSSYDAMGATAEQLAGWVKRNVDPLVDQAAMKGPDIYLLSQTGQRAFDAYLGLALYAEAILPPAAFARSLKLTGSTAAIDYPKAIVEAAQESDSYVLNIPERLKGKRIWVPLGKGKLVGQAGIVKRTGDWALIESDSSALRILNTNSDKY